jgi:4-amino-4-deoxy-L-arabinose transferase-like glycosyltransferase
MTRQAAFASVLSVATALRIVWVFCVPVAPVSDSWAYDVLARNLARGIGYDWYRGNPTANWPVGTSFVYSIFYRLFGFTYTPIIFWNIVISLATIWLVMLLAERWFDRKVAIVAGYLLALWPVQIEFTSVLGSEMMFNVLILCWLAILELATWNRWAKVIAMGILAATTCYIRPVALLLPIVFCIREIILSRKLLTPLVSMTTIYLVMAVLIAPWSIRNTRTFGHFFLVSTNAGSNIWEGNNPGGNGETEDLPPEIKNMSEGQREIYLGNIAKTYIRQHPGLFIARTVKKAFLLYGHETIGVHWNLPSIVRIYGNRVFWVLKLISDLFWWAVLALGLWGAGVVFTRVGILSAILSFPILLWTYFTGVYSTTVVQDRYHFAAIPFIAILAAVALQPVWKKMTSSGASHEADLPVLQSTQ